MSERKEKGIPPGKVIVAGLGVGLAAVAGLEGAKSLSQPSAPPGMIGTASASDDTIKRMIDLGSIKLEEGKAPGAGSPASE